MDDRLRRAEALSKEWPFAAEVLGFYVQVLEIRRAGGGREELRFLVGDRGEALLERLLPPTRPVPEEVPAGRCPSCGGLPGAGVLREDKIADTLRRTLVCSACDHEWEFPRVVCPNCGEEKAERLPRFTAQEIPWMRIEACDGCGTYLKSVDLTVNPAADPVVDDLGALPLDLIAREKGYVKITPNLAGL